MNNEYWGNKNVLVTGAGGFKGSHLVEALTRTQANVVALLRDFDPKSYFEYKNLGKKCTVVIGDLKDDKKIRDILTKYQIDVIFHLGAQPIVTIALQNPIETLETNIMGTVILLESARVYGKIESMVMVSSDKAYGPSKNVPYKEDERLHGKAPYDVSKSCADLISQMYAGVYNLPVTIARCANVFGPGDLNMNRIIPGAIESAINGNVLEIRSDGKMIREYIYVKDCIEGYILLAENISKTRGQAFNLASDNIMDVLGVVKNVSKAIEIPIKIKILHQAKAEIPEQHLDASKIKSLLGWRAKVSFNDAVRKSYEWYQEIL